VCAREKPRQLGALGSLSVFLTTLPQVLRIRRPVSGRRAAVTLTDVAGGWDLSFLHPRVGYFQQVAEPAQRADRHSAVFESRAQSVYVDCDPGDG